MNAESIGANKDAKEAVSLEDQATTTFYKYPFEAFSRTSTSNQSATFVV